VPTVGRTVAGRPAVGIAGGAESTDRPPLADIPAMHRTPSSFVRSDQMLMAGHILQAFERGGMPMHAAGYLELSSWATDELGKLDSGTLQDVRFGVPRALREIIENLLYERRESECRVNSLARVSAQSATRALLGRLRAG
jgi:hypothetical protein